MTSAHAARSFGDCDMSAKNGAIKLVAGNSNPTLAQAISDYLKTPLTKAVVRRFADMEIFVEIQENVRGADCFIIKSTSIPANDHLMRCGARQRDASPRSSLISAMHGRTANRVRARRSHQNWSPI